MYELMCSRYDGSEKIKSLGLAWAFTQSENSALGCPRKWTYGYMQSYKVGSKSKTLIYGIVWHTMCEWFLMDIEKYKSKDDFKRGIDENLNSWIWNELDALEDVNQSIRDEWFEDIHKRICNAAEGWRIHWMEKIYPNYEVAEVEYEVCAKILRMDGKPFRPRLEVIEYTLNDGSIIMRPCFVSEVNHEIDQTEIELDGKTVVQTKVKTVVWPWYKIGKIDAILKCRKHNRLFILDHKTTTKPGSYESRMSFDLQLPGYGQLLQDEIDAGVTDFAKKYKGCRIEGYIWDICYSNVPSVPKTLISGKLSTSKGRGCPSWQFEIAMHDLLQDYGSEDAVPGNWSDYQDYLEWLKTDYDQKYFRLCETHFTSESMRRAKTENYITACKIADLRKKLSNLPCESKINSQDFKASFDFISHRYPLCDRHGNCEFGNFCVANNTPWFIYNMQSPKIYWRSKPTN